MTVQPYLGPSKESIHQTILLQEDWFDNNVRVVDTSMFPGDPYGEDVVVYGEDADEDMADAVGTRLSQLHDLIRLNERPSLDLCFSSVGFTCDFNARQLKELSDYENQEGVYAPEGDV